MIGENEMGQDLAGTLTSEDAGKAAIRTVKKHLQSDRNKMRAFLQMSILTVKRQTEALIQCSEYHAMTAVIR